MAVSRSRPCALAVRGDKRFRFGVRQVLNTLLGPEMEFDPHTSLLALIIEKVWLPNKCMWRKDRRNSAVGHDNGHLMQCFR